MRVLEARMAAVREKAAGGKDWLRTAEAALKEAGGVVENLREYTRDAQDLYAWRARLAGVIAAAPVK